MSTELSAFEKFQDLLRGMFQFDNNELDFGLFKVLRLKRTFIEQFINGNGDQDLKAIVVRELANIRQSDQKAETDWIARYCSELGPKGKLAWEALSENPTDPDLQDNLKQAVNAAELPEKLDATLERIDRWFQGQSVSSTHLEAQLYNYLLNFFDLYYQNGDFGYNSRSSAAFSVPYEAAYDGADTMFHFKHRDCYYIKTGNSFPEVALEIQGKRIAFRLDAGGDSQTTAQNNNKDAAVKLYELAEISEDKGGIVVRFRLAKAGTPKVEIYRQLLAILDPKVEIEPYLFKKAKDDEEPAAIFKDLAKDHDKAEGGQIKGINQLRLTEEAFLGELAKLDHFKDLGSNAAARAEALRSDATAQALLTIDRALNRFYVGQDADYFIHKDLKGFLSREKDRFIKSVIFSDLDALLSLAGDPSTRVLARAFNSVADRIIEFLDATETFQRNLFTLKKKVIDTHWLISIGKIPEVFWERLLANKRLVEWWSSEFGQSISGLEDLRSQLSLVVDTSLFESDEERSLVDAILSDPAFDHLDEQSDGLLIHSENWQALNLLTEKFRERIQCIYIDPPYNTGGDGFLYKDSFRHSSWAAMMADRLNLAKDFLSERGVLFASIDDKERDSLDRLLRETFGTENRVEELIWAQNTTKNQSPTYSTNHEYVQVFARNLAGASRVESMFREPKPGYSELTELVAELNATYPTIAEIEGSIRSLFEQHKADVKKQLEQIGLKYTSNRDPWKGLYNYKNAEYRDAKGRLINEADANSGAATIWIWREIDPSAPAGKQSESTRDPESPNYRFYKPVHPNGEACSHPKRGWGWPKEFDPDDPNRPSFGALNADARIVWGADENKIPQVKKFLHEVETQVVKSVITDYTDGEKELTNITGKTNTFPNPKPTTLISGFIEQTTQPGDWVMDFFVGSGTTGHAIFGLEDPRRFLLSEMGDYFDQVTKPRIAKLMFSKAWKDGKPTLTNPQSHLVKVQRLEQYEDILANLEAEWDQPKMPQGVPVRYLFRPDESRVRLSLNLTRPFANFIKAGREGTETAIDLLETRALLQGYWVRSRRTFTEGVKDYRAIESECGCLILFRDIEDGEDDSEAVNKIAASYANEDGSQRIARLELNHWADLRKLTLPSTLIVHGDFDRGAQWS